VTLVAGVDGGGTHARAVIVDERGQEVARAEVPGAVASAEFPERAALYVSRAVHAAAERAGVELPLAFLWAGLAGAGAQAARSAVAGELGSAALADRVVVGTDVEAAFHDAFGEEAGILLIAGTGSIAWARDLAGVVVRVGGWGERLGDEGSGFAIGSGALRAVARAHDRRGPETALRDSLLAHLALGGPQDLDSWWEDATKRDVAALAPLVARASAEGDAVARDLLATAVSDLIAHISAVLDGSDQWPEAAPLVLWGGLISDGGPLRDALVGAVSSLPVRLESREVDPPMGAANMALAALAESPSTG